VAGIAHVLHAAQLRELADGKSFERGQRYHREGRVHRLTRAGKTIQATVAGQQPYEVKLWVTGDRIAYVCSCPVGDEGLFCKHCVAVALALIDESESAPEPEARPNVIVAPQRLPDDLSRSVFLAGSIDMGSAPPWQSELVEALADAPELTVLNPRRADWDDSWEQSVKDARFCEQVAWELEAMERADVIAMYFAPDSRAPVTLLELGLHARSGKLIVCCPEGFWRKGNVDMVCRRYGVHQVHDAEALERAIRARVGALS
jgi:hypothetical protein